MRNESIQGLKNTDMHPYPHKFHVSIGLTEYISKYGDIEPGQMREGETCTVAG